MNKAPKNIFGQQLQTCSKQPLTGFFRDGTCRSDERDGSNHSVCGTVSQEFLEYSKSQGNDLVTPNPRYGFTGLKPGDNWCLCAARWLEAKEAGVEVKVNWKASHARASRVIPQKLIPTSQLQDIGGE